MHPRKTLTLTWQVREDLPSERVKADSYYGESMQSYVESSLVLKAIVSREKDTKAFA